MADFIDKTSNVPKCTWCNKNLYRTEKEAQEAANLQRRYHGAHLTVYKCPVHTGFHLTSGKENI